MPFAQITDLIYFSMPWMTAAGFVTAVEFARAQERGQFLPQKITRHFMDLPVLPDAAKKCAVR